LEHAVDCGVAHAGTGCDGFSGDGICTNKGKETSVAT
jgi:hypothetical protein